jgi:hypothetical protein
VLSLRRKGIRVASDYRIMGGSEFVQGLLSEVDEREKETLRLSSKIKGLDSLAGSIDKNEGITGLRSASRTRKVSRARRLFCQFRFSISGNSNFMDSFSLSFFTLTSSSNGCPKCPHYV